MKPALQIRKHAAVFLKSGSLTLKKTMERTHCVRLPQFLEPQLLSPIQRHISHASFYKKRDKGIALEACMKDNSILRSLIFLMNDFRLFRCIQTITDCPTIQCFSGRVYAFVPGQGHYDSWHNDLNGRRLIGVSINLSPTIFQGGVFQIRDKNSKKIYYEAANTGPGDALLFRISPHLQHQVTTVHATAIRYAFAGWFQSKPSYLTMLKNLKRSPKFS